MSYWYKAQNNIINSPMLAMVAKSTKSYKSEVIAYWFALMERASQKNNSGNLCDIDHDETDFALEFTPGKSKKLYEAFEARGKIKDGTLVNWAEYQPETSTERVKKYRENKKKTMEKPSLNDETNETFRNVAERFETHETARPDLTRPDQNGTEKEGRKKNTYLAKDNKTPPTPSTVENSVDKPVKKGVGAGVFINSGRELLSLLSEAELAKAKQAAPGWDIYPLAEKYVEGIPYRGMPDRPSLAFIAWVGKYTKGSPPG